MWHKLCFINLLEVFEGFDKEVNKGKLVAILVFLKGFWWSPVPKAFKGNQENTQWISLMEFCRICAGVCPGKHTINCWDKQMNREVRKFEDDSKLVIQSSKLEDHLWGNTKVPQETVRASEIYTHKSKLMHVGKSNLKFTYKIIGSEPGHYDSGSQFWDYNS